MSNYNNANFLNEFPKYCKSSEISNSGNILNKYSSIDKKAPNDDTRQKNWFSKIKSIFPCGFFRDFCNETTIHGFNHIVAPRRHIIEKLGWLAATIMAAVCALQLCLEQWQRYVASPTVVALEKDYRNWNNTFMALTACQQLKNTRNQEAFLKKTWGVSPDDDKYKYYLKYIEVVSNATVMNMGLFEPFKDDATLKTVSMFDIATNVITPLNSLVLWYDKSINVSFVNVMTDMGICHTINSIVSKDQIITIPDSKNFIGIDNIIQCAYITHPCYLRVEIPEICMTYYVHSAYDIMDVSSEKVRTLCKGQDANTDWTVVETKASIDVRDLRIEQRKCQYYDEPVEGSIVYSNKICLRKCRNSVALKLCGCRPFFYFQEAGEPCDAAGMVCLGKNVDALLHPESCKCQAQCEEAKYEMASIRESTWTGPLGVRNSIKVGLVAPRSRYRRQILFGFEDLVVSFGGAAGLFLGCSFLSGVEIVYFILERFTTFSQALFCKKIFQRKKMGSNKLAGSNEQKQKSVNSIEDFNIVIEENPRNDIVKKFIEKIAVFEKH